MTHKNDEQATTDRNDKQNSEGNLQFSTTVEETTEDNCEDLCCCISHKIVENDAREVLDLKLEKVIIKPHDTPHQAHYYQISPDGPVA